MWVCLLGSWRPIHALCLEHLDLDIGLFLSSLGIGVEDEVYQFALLEQSGLLWHVGLLEGTVSDYFA